MSLSIRASHSKLFTRSFEEFRRIKQTRLMSTAKSETITSVRRPESYVAKNKTLNILVINSRNYTDNELAALEDLPPNTNLVAKGAAIEDFKHLTDDDWNNVEVVAIGGRTPSQVWQKATGVKWIHSLFAGVNSFNSPEVQALNIPVTNAKGVFSHSLAEYALFACNYFAKNLPRLLQSKKEKKWDVFPVEELRGRTMGIIGLGDIGFSTARVAKAFKMNIVGLRRNRTLSESEKSVVDEVYTPDELNKLMAMSDYIVAALPLTEQTKGFINAEAINSMQSHAVYINIGRGATTDEDALIKTLQEKRIRGAALDVFAVEPLPKDSPFYELDNVLISSHNADKTDHFVLDSISLFKKLVEKYMDGLELENLVDLKAGY